MAELPVISLAAFDRPADAAREKNRLYDVCCEHGFFYVSDHGIPKSQVVEAIQASRAFFALPLAVKQRYGHAAQMVSPRSARGYTPPYGETLSQQAGPDPKELFDLGLEQPLGEEPFVGPTVLPDEAIAPGFVSSLLTLQATMMGSVAPRLLRALALALGQEEAFFDPYFSDPILIQRVIHYPADGSFAGKHTDNGIFTLLIQEDLPAPSLRVFTKDSWIDAPPLPGTFVVNLGDMLQLWTAGAFKSTPHQVIHELPVSRISLPFFVYPNITASFRPLSGDGIYRVKDIMLRNFQSIWVAKTGAGRARELV